MSSLLRSTKFVRYFTGAARTLILNTAKTTEVSTLINPKALSSANNVLLRDYATSKKAESLEPLLQRLDSEVRRYGRITKRDIDEVLEELKGKNNITSSQSLLVIRCCGELVPEELPEQRTLLVQKIWNILTERGIPMDISHYNALLRVYIENEHPFSPAQFLEELENKGIQPNRVTYQRLMWRYCQEGDVEGATKVLEKMRELNFPVSEPVLNALVMGHAFHGDTDGAKAVLETMAGAGLQPTNHTYTLLACGYAKKGDLEGVKDTIKTANEKDAYMTDKDILDIIEQLALGGHSDKIDQIFGYLQKNFGYNQDVCNLILKLLNKGQIETAKAGMKTMPKNTNFDDTMFKGAFFVKQLLRVNVDNDKVIQICKELQQENLVPNALYIATETALQLGRSELAQKLFKEIQKDGWELRQHYYWPILVQKGKEGDEEGLLQILRTMSAEGLTPTGETLKDYVIPYLINKDTPQNVILKLQIANVPTILGARNLMMELLDAGSIKDAANLALQFRLRGQFASLARPLLNALGKTKDIESFASILHIVSSSPQPNQADEEANEDGQPDERAGFNEVSRIVTSAVKILSKPELVEQLLSALHSKGISISTESAESIQQQLDKNMTTAISELLTKLTSVDLEPVMLENTRRSTGPRTAAQLEKLIDQIKNKDSGSNVTRLQKQLLLAYIKENNMPKVQSYLEELKASNFALSSAMLAQLYEFYCQNDEIEKAKECKAQLAEQAPEFELNKYKQLLMVNALIKADRFDEAIQFLNDNKAKGDDDNSNFVINSKCWQILNTLAEQKEEVKVQKLTQALIENNFVEASNVILGPLIKAHLQKNDIEGALKQFEICCNQYRCTPWKGELMKTLIMKEDASKLQWLADLSTQIHGEVNILHDLVLAFVECGRLRQARRILETPGMHTRQRRLDSACQRYLEEGKSEYLEGLLEATKELSHIDRSNIFYHLLVTYCKADETDKAVGLWTILQEEGEVPSNQFLAYLGNHLKSKNRPVPFVMPEETKVEKPKKNVQQLQNLPTKNQISEQIETLVKEGQAVKAMDIAIRSIEKGTMPKTSILKYVLKNLAEAGHVEKIQELGKFLSDANRRRLTYDDKLTLAVFNKGSAAKHIDSMIEEVKSAATIEDFEAVLTKFPRSNALASIVNNETLVAKCQKVAELAASKGNFTPVNLLWMEYILAGKEKEANELWKQWLCKSPNLLFRRLLQESHTTNNVKIIENLLETMKSNNLMTKGSFGNVYSRLINMYLANNKLNEAESALRKAFEEGVQLEHFNKNCIDRLKAVMKDAGKEFNYFN